MMISLPQDNYAIIDAGTTKFEEVATLSGFRRFHLQNNCKRTLQKRRLFERITGNS